jgi:Flp pilus assembly pilin Flp
VIRGRAASARKPDKEVSMFYALMGYAQCALERRLRPIRKLVDGEKGQGTVEYVGLILLVSLLMVGMVAAMKGFNRSFSKAGY